MECTFDDLCEASRSQCASEDLVCELIKDSDVIRGKQWQQVKDMVVSLTERDYWKATGEVLKQTKCDELLHPRVLDVVVKRACQDAEDGSLIDFIIPACSQDGNMLSPLASATLRRKLWRSAGAILNIYRMTEDLYDGKIVWQIVTKAAKKASGPKLLDYILPNVSQPKRDTIVKRMRQRKLWTDIGKALRWRTVSDKVLHEVMQCVSENSPVITDATFIDFLLAISKSLLVHVLLDHRIVKRYSQLDKEWRGYHLARTLPEQCPSRVLDLILAVVEWLATQPATFDIDESPEAEPTTHFDNQENTLFTTELYDSIKTFIKYGLSSPDISSDLKAIKAVFEEAETEPNVQTEMKEFAVFITSYINWRFNEEQDEMLLALLACAPIFPDVQNIALTFLVEQRDLGLLKKKRWKVMKIASLTFLWEETRRAMWQAAVKEGKWAVVSRWADPSLYDDQRSWALSQALEHREWQVRSPHFLSFITLG